MTQRVSRQLQAIAALINKNQPEQAFAQLRQLEPEVTKIAKYQQLLGITCAKLGRQNDAIIALETALTLEPDVVFVHNALGKLYKQTKQLKKALANFDKAIALAPGSFDDYNNRGVIYTELEIWDKASSDLDNAIRLNPNSAAALVNKGYLYFHKKESAKALQMYLKALEIDPRDTAALYNVANIYQNLGDYRLSFSYLEKLYALKAQIPFFLGMYLHAKMNLCDWHNFDEIIEQLTDHLQKGKRPARPFQVMALLDRPDLEKISAYDYVKAKFPTLAFFKKIPATRIENRRIRVGYFSSDFCNHPVSYLMTRVFEQHDRNKFEIYAYSFNPNKSDHYTESVKNSVDHFFDVRQLTNKQLVMFARNHGLDIAVDLNGITKHCRTAVFGERVAQVQINYLGYLGTVGVDYFDYIIADQVLIPQQERAHYAESVLYLPVYQANDDTLPDFSLKGTRSAYGLPEKAFVFCSFNNNFKIHPHIFNAWMEILKQVPDSVLWLYVTNEVARQNILDSAARMEVDPSRIVFAQKVSLPQHIARQTHADLFLDTYPYNGGATTTSALRAGLPVLTLCGRSFSSRMGASLLSSIGVRNLITQSLEEYKNRAVTIATNKVAYAELVSELQTKLKTTDLYNTTEFVKNLEEGYRMILKKKGVIKES